jgi:5-methylcytosine-specific restriction endonuclease McrA
MNTITSDAARAALLSSKNPYWAAKTLDVWLRAQGRCEYCGTYLLATSDLYLCGSPLDHIVAKSLGGADDLENLALSCRPCNVIKRHHRLWDGIGERPAREELIARAKAYIDKLRARNEVNLQRHIELLIACGLPRVGFATHSR